MTTAHDTTTPLYRHIIVIWFLFVVAAMLRLPFLTMLPSGFNWDETAYAYNAYSLLKTGQDEWGASWPLFLKSFSEYKPALLSYLLIPVFMLFGVDEVSVRLVPAVLGCLAVVATYGLVWRVSKNVVLAFFTAFTLALSPWHIHFSRVALDPGVAHPLLLLGLWVWSGKKWWQAVVGSALLILSAYAYNAERIFVPLVIGAFALSMWRPLFWQTIKKRLFALGLLFVGLSLIISTTLWGSAGARARTVTFQLTNFEQAALRYSEQWAGAENAWFSWSTHPVFLWLAAVAKQYSLYWRPDFLFFKEGGVNASPILGFPMRGNLLEVFLPLFIVGLIVALRSSSKADAFFGWWLLLSPIPGALTVDGPHAGRALIMLPAVNYFIARGVVGLAQGMHKEWQHRVVYLGIWIAFSLASMSFIIDYVLFYPQQSENAWQGQFRDMSRWVGQQSAEKVYLSNHTDTHALLFYAWYNQVDPAVVQAGTHAGTHLLYLQEYGSVRLLEDGRATACALLQENSIVVLSPGESVAKDIAPSQIFYYQESGVPPRPAFGIYLTERVTATQKERLEQNCDYSLSSS